MLELTARGVDLSLEVDGLRIEDVVRAVGSPEMQRLLLGDAAPDAAALLLRAAADGDAAGVQRFLAEGADPNSADADGDTPLLLALAAGASDAVPALLAAGADANHANAEGLTPLAVALLSADLATLTALLDAGADPNGTLRGVPFLGVAIVAGRAEVAHLLLDRGAVPATDPNGATTAALAKAMGLDDVAERLGGVPEPAPRVDLVSAVVQGTPQEVRTALEEGASPDTRSPAGVPVLHLAALRTDDQALLVMRALIDAGADIEATDLDGANVLHVVLTDGRLETMRKLGPVLSRAQMTANAGAFERLLTQRDRSGRSAMVRLASTPTAAEQRPGTWWTAIAERGRQLANTPDPDGVTPFLAAVLGQNIALLQAFQARDVEPRGVEGQPSLQDVARAQGAWAALAWLPDDRVLPPGLRLGVSLETKRELQRRLQAWGYYTGGIDGVFGPGSRAAMTRFLQDRREELIAMAPHHPDIRLRRFTPGGDENRRLTVFGPVGEACYWEIVEWQARPNMNESTQFIGCVQGGERWNANGIAYVEYARGGNGIFLFGEGGWEGRQELR